MKKIDSYLNKYTNATPLWSRTRSDLALYLSNNTKETVQKNQISISGRKIYLRGVSAALRSYLLTHQKEINQFIQSIPEAKQLHL